MTTYSSNNGDASQYTACAIKFSAISDKFETAFGMRTLNSTAALALLALAESVSDIAEYRQVVQIIATHMPIASDDLDGIKNALQRSQGINRKRVNDDIKNATKERNEQNKERKQQANNNEHGINRAVNWVDMSGGNNPKKLDTLPNTRALLDAMNITIRYNMMTREDEYSGGITDNKELDSSIVRIVSAGKSLEYNSKDIGDHLSEIARENQYHPVRDWLGGVKWDGVSRIQALADTLHSDINPTLKLAIIKRWAVGAIKSVMMDNPPALQGVLVLQGEQRIGKTTWLTSLCTLQRTVLDGMELNPHNIDSVRKATSAWIVELGELDGTLRREIAAIKAFITKQTDLYRLPYSRSPRAYVRRTAYVASVNERQFLQDHTGNGRWWTIAVSKIDRNNIDMQQFWAEMRDLAAQGEPHNMQPDELALLNASNKDFEQIDTYEELIIEYYGPASDCVTGVPLTPMTTTNVAESLVTNPDSRVVQAVGRALKKCGYSQSAVKINGRSVKAYRMPPKLR